VAWLVVRVNQSSWLIQEYVVGLIQVMACAH